MATFISPIPGALITSGWLEPREYRNGVHRGLDFKASIGTPVRAIADGVVFHAQDYVTSSAGKWIGVDHKNGFKSRYLHLDKIMVQKGQPVYRGNVIGLSGRTGIEISAAHLHFDMTVLAPSFATGGIVGPESSWGYWVPGESYIPGNYSQKVIDNAKKRGVPLAAAGISFGLLLLIGGGVAYYLWRKQR